MIELPRHIDLDNQEFRRALELLRYTDANIFLTGKAGTGKSTFLRYVCGKIRKRHVVLAPTGVAAVNVGGVTIHSFFQMPLRPVPPDDPEYSVRAIAKSGRLSRKKRKLIEELELIIIDEVSMVRPDMMDFIDRTLRAVTGRRGLPFGGVQLLLVGDIFQLEPVVTQDMKNILSKYYPDFFFFNALAYRKARLVAIELRKIYRQTDLHFIELLDRIRMNRQTSTDIRALNERVGPPTDSEADDAALRGLGITLSTRREGAAAINREKMDALPSEEVVYEGEIKDDFPEKLLPTDLDLVLKVDAQVMMIRNDKDRRWVNGTLAKVVELKDDAVVIELEGGKRETVAKETWENINYIYDEKERKVKEEVLGTFTQYPLRAAWALTIHKSQGLTFSNVAIDMGGGAFSAGQTYVALSRCRSMEGITFLQPLRKYDVIVSHGAADFSKCYNDREAAERALREAAVKRLGKRAVEAYHDGRYYDAVEDVWKIHTLSGALERIGVRRLIGKIIGEVRILKKELKKKERIIARISRDLTEEGDKLLSADGHDRDKVEAALGKYAKAVELDKDNDRAAYKMSVCQMELGEKRKSLKILDRLVKDGSELKFDALMFKGYIKEKEGDTAGAVLNYLAAMKERPSDKGPVEELIRVYDECGIEDQAEAYRDYLRMTWG